MKIDVLTIFPEMFTAVKSSILGKAEERGILDINLINIRDYTSVSYTHLFSTHRPRWC